MARGRFPYGFGARSFVLLLVGLVWVGPAWWEPRFLLGMAVWDLLLVVLWFADLAGLPKPNQLTVQRSWRAPVGLGMTTEVTIEISQRGKRFVAVVATDNVAATLCPNPPELEFGVPTAGSARATYEVHPTERGDATLGRVYLRYQGRLQLAERRAEADLTQTVRVYPNLEESKRHSIYLIRSRQIEMEKRLRRQRGRGREFESLREYREGDERRDICWTATARRGKLISKVYQVERSQTVWIVLDAGRLLRARVAGLSKLDYAINAALSLAHVAAHSGDRVGLLAYGRNAQQVLGPGTTPAHLRAFIECLALVRAEAAEADHLRAAHLLLTLQKGRSLIVWLTDVAESAGIPEVVEIASRTRSKHLLLLAVISQPELAQLAAVWPRDVEQMYRQVAGMEVLQRRELLLRRLREHGALALELEPNRLALALVNEYLEIKDRSLL